VMDEPLIVVPDGTPTEIKELTVETLAPDRR
jgi:hypothetical protein